jgi:hypothetical protein
MTEREWLRVIRLSGGVMTLVRPNGMVVTGKQAAKVLAESFAAFDLYVETGGDHLSDEEERACRSAQKAFLEQIAARH